MRMPRHYGEIGIIKSELPATEEIFNRKPRQPKKSSEYHHNHRNLTRCQSCMKCELPKFEMEASIQEKRKKHKSQVHHCPSCHCHPETTKYSMERGPREKHTENVEAMLEQYQNYLVDPQNSSMKRSRSPFSLPTGLRCRPSRDIHGFKRAPTAGQHQSSKNEYSEELHAMLTDMINSGLTDENTEIFDKNTLKKENSKQDGQLPCDPEESELDSDCSKKSFSNHCESKKDKVGCFEKSRESREKCEKEMYEELKQTKRDCEEINQLTLEVKEFEKMKGMRKNSEEKMEKKQMKYRKEEDTEKRKLKFTKKIPISRFDDLSEGNNFSKMGAYPQCKIKASTSYQSLPSDDKDFDNEAQVDFSNRVQLQQDLKGNPLSKLFRRTVVHNSQVQKSEENDVEILNFTNENEFKNKGEESNEGRKNLYAGGDLDLHACKSYVVDLIDRALSKQLGTQPGEKKSGVNKPAHSWQEMCIEVTRALQGDYCQSFAQNLYNFQENMDNVRLLKSFRWAYVKHIQEELRSLEKIIDICSPRIAKKEPSTS